ncbi:hypothetical protein PAPYR_11636 [Paratrimastix pyriformis]|uniref:Uncharacterized protein n=1 Tax=Paratrimastix pyriformis TaxID=342808 RepID=A0ABQ8U8X4_9EUKA|nr:hypothetical protein PAPYR_11636 [Paratrimastix pyriformis]
MGFFPLAHPAPFSSQFLRPGVSVGGGQCEERQPVASTPFAQLGNRQGMHRVHSWAFDKLVPNSSPLWTLFPQTRKKVRVDETGEWDASGTTATVRQRFHNHTNEGKDRKSVSPPGISPSPTPTFSNRPYRGCRSLGRSSAWHAGGKGIETPQLHPSFFLI